MSYYWFLPSLALINANLTTMKNKIAYEDYNLSLKVVSQVLEQNFQKDSLLKGWSRERELFQHDWVYIVWKTRARTVKSGYT